MADRTDGLKIIEDALAAGLHAQASKRVEDIDVARLAAGVARALAQVPTPLDPEGDGLEPDEINAANDI